ncbi:hypothetical protein INT47_002624 [Mucor saturninus]|uniref:RGS domain-containing protein n=1 Tax=Mucor saturninus TaxID=64648 RepID=A0A8H7R6X7_9FUNG|nr:hypothetical protein INT47_002624 [Mucor saturninus]
MVVFSDIVHGFGSVFETPDGLTLEMVLSDKTSSPFSLFDFSEYLKQTYCNENLMFYQAVMDYKERCSAYFDEEFDYKHQPEDSKEILLFETLKNKFEIILQTFILTDATQEINIPYEIRHQLLSSYQRQQCYHPDLLDPACNAVIELLRISAFIPFATDPSRLKKKSLLKRITTSLKSRYPLASLDSPPMSPKPTWQ